MSMNKEIHNLVLHLSSILKNCIQLEVESDKNSQLAYTLIQMGINPNSPLLIAAIETIIKDMREDYGWLCPYDTSLNINLLSNYSENNSIIQKSLDLLFKWKVQGMWGRNERDGPRLLATADVLTYINSKACYLGSRYKKEAYETAGTIWAKDIQLVGYIFKARAFLDIAYFTRDFVDLSLLEETIKMILDAQENDGSIRFAAKAQSSRSSISEHARVLISLTRWLNIVPIESVFKLANYIKGSLYTQQIYSDIQALCNCGVALSRVQSIL